MDNRLKGQALGICEVVDALLAEIESLENEIRDKDEEIDKLEQVNKELLQENDEFRLNK